MRRFGTVLALIGLGLAFLLFGLISVGEFSELLDGRLDLEMAGAAIITFGSAVTSGWIVAAAIVKRSEFEWGVDAFRACAAFAIAGGIGSLIFAASIIVQNADNLGRIVFFDSSARCDCGWYWPAWLSVLAWVAVAVLFGSLGRLFWRVAGPSGVARRRSRR